MVVPGSGSHRLTGVRDIEMLCAIRGRQGSPEDFAGLYAVGGGGDVVFEATMASTIGNPGQRSP